MKLSEWLELERGRAVLLAAAMGISPVLISQWASEKRTPPFGRCVSIERLTLGGVTRRDLRPNDFGDMWPELVPTQVMEDGVSHANKCAVDTPEKSAVLPGYPPVTTLQTIPNNCNESAQA